MSFKYRFPMYERLKPCRSWKGGRITETDLLTLADAAREASKHACTEVTPADFLRAAARGEIALRAIVHARARVQKCDGGIYCNQGTPDENTVPRGAIPTLPLTACQQLANAGRASWRTFEGFEHIEGELCRFDAAWLVDGEPNFETVPDDCRVTGFDVHALADAYLEDESDALDLAGTVVDAPELPEPVPAQMEQEAGEAIRDWKELAREIADEKHAADARCGSYSTNAEIADAVAQEMRKRGISGSRGAPLSEATVLKEALQGERWKRKPQPGNPG